MALFFTFVYTIFFQQMQISLFDSSVIPSLYFYETYTVLFINASFSNMCVLQLFKWKLRRLIYEVSFCTFFKTSMN